MKTEFFDNDRFELSQVHPSPAMGGECHVEVCEDGPEACHAEHMYSIYYREPVGGGMTEAHWLADCVTLELARVAIAAFIQFDSRKTGGAPCR